MNPGRVEKCVLINTQTGESMEPLLNPETLTRSFSARYQRHQVPGLGYEPMQYQGTSNQALKGVQFYFDALIAAQRGYRDIREFEAFLRAFLYPPEGSSGGLRRAPPRVLVVWPGVVTITCVLTDLEVRDTLFFSDASRRVYRAVCGFEAIHFDNLSLTSESQRQEW